MQKPIANHSGVPVPYWKLQAWHICVLVCVAVLMSTAVALENGVYLLKKSSVEDSHIKLPGGFPAEIDRKLVTSEFNLSVISLSNLNDEFSITFEGVPDRFDGRYVAIAVDSEVIVENGGRHVFSSVDRASAEKIAAIKNETPSLRQHKGHKLVLRFRPTKKLYSEGERIFVDVQLHNIGTIPVFVRCEVASDKKISTHITIAPELEFAGNCRDVRDAYQRMTIYTPLKALMPGEMCTLASEDLRNWYDCTKPGRYSFVGTYEVDIFESGSARYPIWDEHMASNFEIELSR